jgi:hypothetical protein
MYTVTSIAVFFNGLDQRCVLHVDGPLSCRICLLSARKQHVGVIRRHRALLFVHRTAGAGWLLCLRYNGPAGRRQTPSAFGHVLIAFLSRPAPALGPWSARPPGWRCRLSPGPARDAVCGVWRICQRREVIIHTCLVAGGLYPISWGARWAPPRSQVPSNVIKRAQHMQLGWVVHCPLGP